MAAQNVDIEVWVVIDEDGSYAVGPDSAVATESYDQDFSGSNRRSILVTLSVPLPVTVELRGTVPALGEATLTVS